MKGKLLLLLALISGAIGFGALGAAACDDDPSYVSGGCTPTYGDGTECGNCTANYTCSSGSRLLYCTTSGTMCTSGSVWVSSNDCRYAE